MGELKRGETRLGHANSFIPQRLRKGRKIETILSGRTSVEGKRILDVGTGSGGIAAYFAERGCDVAAVDQEDV